MDNCKYENEKSPSATSVKSASWEAPHEQQQQQGCQLYKNGTKCHQKNGGASYTIASLPQTAPGFNNVKDDGGGGSSEQQQQQINDCGLGLCTPSWLQVFASKQAFLVTFCLTWVLQGMFSTYFVSMITTIEKVFQLQSKMTGLIMSATEIGQISCTLLFTYYGGQGHRPRWIASGMVLFAVSAFACSLPHFIFDSKIDSMIHSSTDQTAATTTTNMHYYNSSNLSAIHKICQSSTASASSSSSSSSFSSSPQELAYYGNNASCEEKVLSEQQSHMKNVALLIFLVSLLGVGMGQTPVYTLGISYIDDNVTGRESPLYFAITIGIRILGPALGFILGSFCTRLYKDLSITPQITPTDPRWVGAWWLGLVLDSAFLMLASLAMFSFPRKLKTYRSVTPAIRSRQENTRKNPRLKDFPKTIKRLLKNDILMLRTASTVLHILPIAGLYTFLPKFLESQFRFPAYTANMAVGVGGILVMGVGIIISGVFILRVKPNAKFVAGWIAFAASLYALGMGILMFVGCPMDDFAGLNYQGGQAVFVSNCSESCNCNGTKFSPVCGEDNYTYFSACYAGCSNVTNVNGITEFSDCSCLSQPLNDSQMSFSKPLSKAVIGYCDFECNSFMLYISIFSIFVFIHSTSEVGSMLLTLRCVDPRDKAMALGVIQFAIGLFGNVPCSIIYGAVVDSACLVWDTICGKLGSCRLYDSEVFRTSFHGTTSAIMLCAFVVDLIVWYKADNINFATDEPLPTTVIHEEELTPITEKPPAEIKD